MVSTAPWTQQRGTGTEDAAPVSSTIIAGLQLATGRGAVSARTDRVSCGSDAAVELGRRLDTSVSSGSAEVWSGVMVGRTN